MSEAAPRNRFAADRMLGKLARYLRMTGYDVAYPPPSSDANLIAYARREGRILLTRDLSICESESVRKGSPRLIEIRSLQVMDQLRQLSSDGWLGGPPERPRCPNCNTILEEMPVEQGRHLLHAFTAATQTSLLYCLSCNILLWQGSHWKHFQEMVSQNPSDYLTPFSDEN